MNCPQRETTKAWLAGLLAADAAEAAEVHAATCIECQDTDAARLPRGEATRFRAPDELRRRLNRALDAQAISRRPASRSFWLGAASGTFGTALAATLAFLLILPPSMATLSDAVAEAHTRALTSGQTITVASNDHHTVKPWFASHIALSPPVADFAQQGFALAGGRIDRIAGEDAAVVVYRHGKHVIDLFVWRASTTRLPDPGMQRGYHTVFWKDNDLALAVVTDMENTEVAKFVALLRSKRE
jgi:anti-sigma factor RsiW